MPNRREIKGHMHSVRSIAKVARAMEMVSLARLQRLQARVTSTRAFAERSWQVLNHLAAEAEAHVRENPMFCGYPQVNRIGIVLITSDKGLVGAYNHEILSLVSRYVGAQRAPAVFITIGKIGREAMLHQGHTIHADFSQLSAETDITALTPVSRVVLDGFAEQTFGEVVLAYTQFQSGMRIKPAIRPLLPICPGQVTERREYLYEPEPQELLLALLPRLIQFQIYQAFVESLAAEHQSRRIAMHQATENAEELISRLQLTYNKVRQQEITSELIDILSGTMHAAEGQDL
jgi:F-type H+-transporting ATPase subunit gamma